MALTPQIRSSQGYSLSVDKVSVTFNISEAQIMAVYNLPAESINASQFYTNIIDTQRTVIRSSQAHLIAVVRGRISNSQLRAWTFDLDSHEFYVIHLGKNKTLVYDRLTKQWSWWADADQDVWKASVGLNWSQSGGIAKDYGSNVVVGDGTAGALWILDPLQGYDDPYNIEDIAAGMKIPFLRSATGQMIAKGRITTPCFQVYLDADKGSPYTSGAKVSLKYSDDEGNSFINAGEIIPVEGNYYQEFVWRSLGLIRSPGRLFQIEDDGAFPTIYDMFVYDGSEGG